MVPFIRYNPYLRQNDMDDDGRCGRNCRLAERYATILYAITDWSRGDRKPQEDLGGVFRWLKFLGVTSID
jgi:hypothetical protein